MAEFIKRAHTEIIWNYTRDFLDASGGGFSFDCNEDGEIDFSKLTECGLANYQACVNGSFPSYKDKGVTEFTRRYRHPAVIRCSCGTEVTLGNFTNTCGSCYADYNNSGSQLVDRKLWGEETNEHWTECV